MFRNYFDDDIRLSWVIQKIEELGEKVEKYTALYTVDSVDDMTDADKIYLLSTNQHLYAYINDVLTDMGVLASVDIDDEVSDTSVNPVQNKVIKAYIDDQIKPNIIQNYPPMSTDTVARLLDIAHSYWKRAFTTYGSASGFLYKSGTGNYTDIMEDSGVDSGVCNTFTMNLMRDVPYEASRYNLGASSKNMTGQYAFTFDDTAEIRRSSSAEPTDIEVRERYVNASNTAKYAYEHGFYTEDFEYFQPCAGDFFFSGNNDNTWHEIDHIGMILACDSINDDNPYCLVAEAYPSEKTDGNDVGFRVSRKKLDDLTGVARFPIGGGVGLHSILFTDTTTHSGTVGTDGKTILAVDSTERALIGQGWVTIDVTCHVASGDTSNPDYLYLSWRENGNSASQKTIFCQNGDHYYLTMYMPDACGTIFSIMCNNNSDATTYSCTSIKVWQGYRAS